MRTNNQRPGLTPRRLARFALSLATLLTAITLTVGAVADAAGVLPGQTPGKLGPASRLPIAGHKGFSTCGQPGQPECPTGTNTWVTVASESPADVLAAMQSCPDYMSPIQAFSVFPANSTFSFDAPVLVKPATTNNKEYQDNLPYFEVRAAVNGIRSVTYKILYDPAHHQLRLDGIGRMTSTDPNYNKSFPWRGVSAMQAASILHTTRGVALAAGRSPELVYFGPQPFTSPKQAGAGWTGGGASPADPIWRLLGADGHLYFIGVEGHVYTPSQLPIQAGATIIQP